MEEFQQRRVKGPLEGVSIDLLVKCSCIGARAPPPGLSNWGFLLTLSSLEVTIGFEAMRRTHVTE